MRGLGWIAVGGALGALVAGCGKEDGPGSARSSAPAIVAEPSTIARTCERLCRRAAGCGVEEIARLAKGADRAVVDEARAEQAEVEKACVERCAVDPPGDEGAAPARRAAACLEQPDCDSLEACLLAASE